MGEIYKSFGSNHDIPKGYNCSILLIKQNIIDFVLFYGIPVFFAFWHPYRG